MSGVTWNHLICVCICVCVCMGKYEDLSCIAFDKEFFQINSLLKCHIRDKD